MKDWEDYYRLLQVDFNAEREIIEAAYKRLSKKYHPDINKSKSSEEFMKKLNISYEILKNSESRREYDREWLEKNSKYAEDHETRNKSEEEQDANKAVFLLKQYFACIREKDFKCAYKYLTEYDKQNLSQEEYIEWQKAVSKFYMIGNFDYQVFSSDRDMEIGELCFKRVVHISVVVSERSLLTEKVCNSRSIRRVVLDGDEWRIYLGHKTVKPFIDKLKELIENDVARFEIRKMSDLKESFDMELELPSMKGFYEEVQKEIFRQERYKSRFSILTCSINELEELRKVESPECVISILKQLGAVLGSTMRKTDYISIWDKKIIFILLTETGDEDLVMVAQKTFKLISSMTFYYQLKKFHLSVEVGGAEFKGSLPDTVKNAYNNVMCGNVRETSI